MPTSKDAISLHGSRIEHADLACKDRQYQNSAFAAIHELLPWTKPSLNFHQLFGVPFCSKESSVFILILIR
jgi:hypothetical protein